MGPTFTKKDGKTYRYYVCIRATKRGWKSCSVKNVAAGEIEGAVMAQMRAVFQSPELIAETCRIARQKEAEEIERLKNERFDLAGELPTASNPLRQRDISERIAEIDATVAAMPANPLSEQQVANALNKLDAVWDELFPAEQARIVGLLVERVVLNEDGIQVRFRPDGLNALVTELEEKEGCINE
jgi:site-specific DNA recombinase